MLSSFGFANGGITDRLVPIGASATGISTRLWIFGDTRVLSRPDVATSAARITIDRDFLFGTHVSILLINVMTRLIDLIRGLSYYIHKCIYCTTTHKRGDKSYEVIDEGVREEIASPTGARWQRRRSDSLCQILRSDGSLDMVRDRVRSDGEIILRLGGWIRERVGIFFPRRIGINTTAIRTDNRERSVFRSTNNDAMFRRVIMPSLPLVPNFIYTERHYGVVRFGLTYFVYDNNSGKQVCLASDYDSALDICMALQLYEPTCPECDKLLIDQDGNRERKCQSCYANDYR